jgi:hypothetical protein
MLAAKEKKTSNIIEYLLYMWQLEDLLRSFKLDKRQIEEKIVSQYQVTPELKVEILAWYKGLVQQMIDEDLSQKGHLLFLQHTIDELDDLHHYLVQKQNPDYLQRYSWAKTHIVALMQKGLRSEITEVEAGLNGLYGYLTLKLQQRAVGDETQLAIDRIGQWLAWLNKIHFQIARGEMELTPND